VLAGGAYPQGGDAGSPIRGVEQAAAEGALVFHAGTALRREGLVTNGGRVLDVTALGSTLAEARESAYAAVRRIRWQGMQHRTDIALAASEREEALRA
jgi:phosphoribosylamine--glycine ligase